MSKKVVLSALLIAIIVYCAFPISRSEGLPDFPRRPKLLLILVIDQFRYDYLVRFRQQFVERGFNLLLDGGANFVNCRYDSTATDTGPGHAALLTGAYGNINGIPVNEWYDRSLHRPAYCVEDPTTKLVGEPEGTAPEAGRSPRNLIGSTVGDELRAETSFESRVISISLKDRAAILMGGHTANAAYWYDSHAGHFVTSNYYMSELPPWVARFNASSPAKAYCGKSWRALRETAGTGEAGPLSAGPAVTEPCPNPQFLSWISNTPFMNEVELNFAWEALRNERLGQGPTTDVLAVSLSVNDYVGHEFGPYSPQVADTTLRTDRYLADFFANVESLVGLENVWIALSADHGVAPTPRFIREHNLGMGIFRFGAVGAAVEGALSSAFGKDQWVEFADGSSIYLNLATLKKHQVDRTKAESVAAEAAASVPGVQAAFTRSQFLNGGLPHTALARKATNSFNARRSGDVVLILEPYALTVSSETTTTHHSPWSYDAQVPLVLWGSVFKPGVYTVPCQPIDMAATLAAGLELTQPSGSQGEPLGPAFK